MIVLLFQPSLPMSVPFCILLIKFKSLVSQIREHSLGAGLGTREEPRCLVSSHLQWGAGSFTISRGALGVGVGVRRVPSCVMLGQCPRMASEEWVCVGLPTRSPSCVSKHNTAQILGHISHTVTFGIGIQFAINGLS